MPTTRSAPIALANIIAKCPKPPTPITPTVLPGPQPFAFNGAYVVTPAQSIGAACVDGISSGILIANRAGTRWYVLYPPYEIPPFRYLLL